MKVGDKVRVISLVPVDREQTNLEIGDVGVIKGIQDGCPIVKFGNEVLYNTNASGLREGGYVMFERQLKLILDKSIRRDIEYHLNEIRRILEEM